MAALQEDEAMLSRLRSRDKKACEECIRQHAPGIYRLALRLMRDQSEAEDVMQDAFLSAFNSIDRFDGRSTLRTWLYRIAYNAAMMRLRKFHPEFVPMEETGDSERHTPLPKEFFDWSSLPEREMEKTEVREELERAIEELPLKLRVVFVLRELDELSTEEAARALEISEEPVKTRLHRARLWLRERLTTYFAPRSPAIGE
jgi:RNA polymerase sigma-70 factor (ECF subfamily)